MYFPGINCLFGVKNRESLFQEVISTLTTVIASNIQIKTGNCSQKIIWESKQFQNESLFTSMPNEHY